MKEMIKIITFEKEGGWLLAISNWSNGVDNKNYKVW